MATKLILDITAVACLALFFDEILICLLLNIHGFSSVQNTSHNVTSRKKRHIFNDLGIVTQILTPKMAIVLLSDLAVIKLQLKAK
ncbi:hypothetical protein [Vibrio coralliirubri]|uniref:hypothetical protein n=1 Tax=Vibrio coralliirubri TaxID=1516159 RepID=UPI0012F81CDE|nr:hypothetical protein [Vibrio coralliirubri]